MWARNIFCWASSAKKKGLLRDTPEWGDIFLQYSTPLKEYIHAGIVLSAMERGRYTHLRSYVDVYTIEGDTNAHAGRRGGRVLRVRRRLLPSHGDCFVRWTAEPVPQKEGGMEYLGSIMDARRVS